MYFQDFFFFFAFHKVLTHVADGCVLVICLIILLLKIDHFYVGSVSNHNRPGGLVHIVLNLIMRLLYCQMHASG